MCIGSAPTPSFSICCTLEYRDYISRHRMRKRATQLPSPCRMCSAESDCLLNVSFWRQINCAVFPILYSCWMLSKVSDFFLLPYRHLHVYKYAYIKLTNVLCIHRLMPIEQGTWCKFLNVNCAFELIAKPSFCPALVAVVRSLSLFLVRRWSLSFGGVGRWGACCFPPVWFRGELVRVDASFFPFVECCVLMQLQGPRTRSYQKVRAFWD